MDDIKISDLSRFEDEFCHYVDDHYPEVRREISTTGDFSDNCRELINKAIDVFKKEGFISG